MFKSKSSFISRQDSVHESFGGPINKQPSRLKTFINGMTSRKNSQRQDPAALASVPELAALECGPGAHVHVPVHIASRRHHSPLAGNSASVDPAIGADLGQWMAAVAQEAPEVAIIHPPRCLQDLPDLPVGSINFNCNRDEYSGKLFLRVVTSKLYYANGQPYRLRIRCGPTQILLSCPSSGGEVQDWFLMDLLAAASDGDLISTPRSSYLGLNDHHAAALTIEALHVASAAEQKASGGLFSSIRRRASRRAGTDSVGAATLEESCNIASLEIPLALLALDELESCKKRPCSPRVGTDERFTELMNLAGRARTAGVLGTFHLVDPATQEAAGEVSLHALVTPNSFTVSRALGRTVQEARHQGPLTFLRPSVRLHFWQRVWGVVLGNELLLYDFQRRDRPQDWALPLHRVLKIELHPSGTAAIAIDNLIEFVLDDAINMSAVEVKNAFIPLSQAAAAPSSSTSKAYAYADSADAASQWINQISMAVWGQPFNTSY